MRQLLTIYIAGSVPWLISSYCATLIISILFMILCCHFTTWGQQFWLLNKDLIFSRFNLRWWAYSLLILLMLLISTRLFVIDSYIYSNVFTSVQEKNSTIFWSNLVMSIIFTSLEVVAYILSFFLQQRLNLLWRKLLTIKIQSLWLDHENYYLFNFIQHPLDNPDQRVDLDTADLAAKSVSLASSVISGFVLFKESTRILWDLSQTLRFGPITIPKAMFIITLSYIIIAMAATFLSGKPLIGLNFTQKIFEANYRFNLARLRIDSKEIAVRHSSNRQKIYLNRLFDTVLHNALQIINKRTLLALCTQAIDRIPNILVFAIQAPLVFSGKAAIGTVMQANQMIYRLVNSIGTITNSYDNFTEYRATLTRLSEFITAQSQTRSIELLKPQIIHEGLRCTNLTVYTPDHRVIVSDLTISLDSKQALLITGASGIGKSTTLLALTSLWPYAHGEIYLPSQEHCMFVPQQWYLPQGTLRSLFTDTDEDSSTLVNVPTIATVENSTITDADITTILEKINLTGLGSLNSIQDWTAILSPGQIQRIAIARAILHKPQLLFLDESTSALDEELEEKMYQLLRSELLNSTIISIGHRSTLRKFHTVFLTLLPEGKWSLTHKTLAN